MLQIRSHGFLSRKWRLLSDRVLTPEDFREVCASLRRRPVRAQKAARIAARQVDASEKVETRWNGVESTNTAQKGDWVTTSLDANDKPLRDAAGSNNVYVIKSDVFPKLYAPADDTAPPDLGSAGSIYAAKTSVEAIYLSGGFEIVAPWGEIQRAESGYLLLGNGEVYGNNEATFDATYRVLR